MSRPAVRRRRRSRVGVALVVMLVLVLALVVVADRFGATLAERTVAAQLRETADLPAEPDVRIGGFPFLTQALVGRYSSIEVQAPVVDAGTVRLTGLDATLRGVQVPLSQALSGGVDEVPVEQLDATAVVPYTEIGRVSGDRQLTVVRAGELVRVTGSVTVLGRVVTASALSSLRLDGDAVVVTAQSFEAGDGAVGDVLRRALGDRFDVRVPLTELPYGLQVRSLRVAPEGIVVQASARDTVLSAP